MSVIFGWYDFKVKSFSVEDLDLDKEEWGNATFEVRQEVFHIFWLPLVGSGKSYELRKDGALYGLPSSVIGAMMAKKVRTPWYSFFIPVVLIVGLIGAGLFIFIAEQRMRSQSYSLEKSRHDVSINDVQEKLSNLSPNAYLRIVNLDKRNRNAALYLKVIGNKDATYSFQVFEATIPHYSKEKYAWKQPTLDTLQITQSELKKAVCVDYDPYNEKKSGVDFFGDDKKYVIDQIEYFDGAVIDGEIDWDFWRPLRIRKFHYYNSQFMSNKEERSWRFKLKFQNFGIPVNLIEIKNIDNEIQWVDSLPIRFDSYVYLIDTYIQAETTTNPDDLEFKSKFVFEDSLSNQYEYIIHGNEAMYTIDRME